MATQDLVPDAGDDYLIDTDEDGDGIDDAPDVNDSPEQQIDQLLGCYAAVERYGMNPTAFGVLSSSPLMEGTALESMAGQTILFTGGSSEQSVMALESIGSVIKDKMAIWGGRLLSFFHTMSSKVGGVLTRVWENIKTTATHLLESTWDKTKAAGRTIKAHPYKTIFAVVGALGAVVSVLALVGSAGNVTGNASSWQSFIARVKDGVSKIKMPGKQINTSVVDNGKITIDITNTTGNAAAAGTADSLGWTKTAVSNIFGALNRVWAGLKNSVTGFGGFVKRMAQGIEKNGRELPKAAGDLVANKTGSNIAGWAAQQIVGKTIMGWLWMLTGALYKVFSQVFSKAWVMIQETFQSLKSQSNTPATT